MVLLKAEGRVISFNSDSSTPKSDICKKFLGSRLKHEGSCRFTKWEFERAFKDGKLVGARIQMPGFEMRVLIKGLDGKEYGNLLAYEPDTNTVWSIQKNRGKSLEIKLAHKYSTHELQKLAWEKLMQG